jgi:4-methyl-5(b-hydroxyethyl)-thiazole monophosphate biosynthesis
MKRIAVLFATGFEEIEAIAVVDVLRRAGFTCDMVSVMDAQEVRGTHDVLVRTDKMFDDTLIDYDMLVLPGGMPGAEILRDDARVIALVQRFAQESSKYLAAICAAPMVLAAAGVIKNKRLTSYPDAEFQRQFAAANYLDELVVVDDNMITSRGPATTLLFAYTLVEVLQGDSEAIRSAMLYDLVVANTPSE